MCNGHAESCDITDPEDAYKLLCRCRHNTCGPQCERCCPGFVQKAWKQSKAYDPFTCEGKKNCHATFRISYVIHLLSIQLAIASDTLTSVCTILTSIVWESRWTSTVTTRAEVSARTAATTRKASTVTSASQHSIVLMINLLMLLMCANVRRK